MATELETRLADAFGHAIAFRDAIERTELLVHDEAIRQELRTIRADFDPERQLPPYEIAILIDGNPSYFERRIRSTRRYARELMQRVIGDEEPGALDAMEHLVTLAAAGVARWTVLAELCVDVRSQRLRRLIDRVIPVHQGYVDLFLVQVREIAMEVDPRAVEAHRQPTA